MKSCPSGADLSRALSEGASAPLTAHLASCAACRTEWEELGRAVKLAREMPVDLPDAARREQVRTSLLAAARARKTATRSWRGRGLVIAAGLALAAAGGAVALAVGGGDKDGSATAVPAAKASRGVVRPEPGARYVLASAQPDEIVRLEDGTIAVEVDPLQPGERFRVVVGDGEVEVRGTSFAVTAAADHLVAVAVVHGRVEVRPAGGETVTLGAGNSWRPRSAAAAVDTSSTEVAVAAPAEPGFAAPTERAVSPRAPRSAPKTAIEAPKAAPEAAPEHSPAEAAYDEGWDDLRREDFASAAAAFERSWALSPDGALAEDARYWRAVALARIPRPAAAITAFSDFLDGYPQSPRAGSASAMLGWLLLDAGDATAAEQRFRAAAEGGDEAARTSARAGLEALAGRRRDKTAP